MATGGYDHLVVYADREHSANLACLTGFDPRFEEAILIVGAGAATRRSSSATSARGMAGAAPLPMRRHLVPGPEPARASRATGRGRSRRSWPTEGIGPGAASASSAGRRTPDRAMLDVPSYLVDELRRPVGRRGVVENATELLIDAGDGLRVDQRGRAAGGVRGGRLPDVRRASAASCPASGPGMTERDAVALLGWDGTPLSCHLMLTAGARAPVRAAQPRRPGASSAATRSRTAFGIWGALNCRAGFVVEDAVELPEGIRDYVERLVGPYFEAVAEWYAALHVGQTGGALHEIIERRLGDPFFGIFLNPGHQLHLDEWVNSPIWPGSTVELRSGMAFQVDIIPATGTAYFTTNIEDGIALADGSLRGRVRGAVPRRLGADRGATRVHGRCPRDRAASRCAAVLEHPGLPATVPPATRSRHDRRDVTTSDELLVLHAEDAELAVDAAVGARLASLVVGGHELLLTEGAGPIWWGCYRWCRSPAGSGRAGSRSGAARTSYPSTWRRTRSTGRCSTGPGR